MLKKSTILLCHVVLLAGATIACAAGTFLPPAEGPVAFRRDRIPMEVDSMTKLSQQVETLARGMNAKTAKDRRSIAQMIALALALDPANTSARDLLSEFQNDRRKDDVKNARLETSRAAVWLTLAWLESPDNGPDSQSLANCLRDIIAVADPRHPGASTILAAGEKGAWQNWVPELSEYETKPLVAKDLPKKPKAETPAQNPIRLDHAQVWVPLWRPIGRTDWKLAASPLHMNARTVKPGSEGESVFSIVIGGRPDLGIFDQLADSIKTLLKSQSESLPQGVRIQITSEEFEQSIRSRNRQSISAAAAVLASSAITGNEPDAIIIGQIDHSGSFKLSTGFWDQLMSLGEGSGQRLVLPTEADTYLYSILSLEKPEFFMQYEVVLASDFKELLALSAKSPTGSFASASAKFREIRERGDAQRVRLYIGNSFVKQRLSAVLQDYPQHLSAKMLLIQASGNRPVTVPRLVLASEIRRTIHPLAGFVEHFRPEEILAGSEAINEAYETFRARVEQLDRYAEKKDHDLVENARELAIALRSLEKASRTRGEQYTIMVAIQTAHTNLVERYTSCLDQITLATGEGIPASKQ